MRIWETIRLWYFSYTEYRHLSDRIESEATLQSLRKLNAKQALTDLIQAANQAIQCAETAHTALKELSTIITSLQQSRTITAENIRQISDKLISIDVQSAATEDAGKEANKAYAIYKNKISGITDTDAIKLKTTLDDRADTALNRALYAVSLLKVFGYVANIASAYVTRAFRRNQAAARHALAVQRLNEQVLPDKKGASVALDKARQELANIYTLSFWMDQGEYQCMALEVGWLMNRAKWLPNPGVNLAALDALTATWLDTYDSTIPALNAFSLHDMFTDGSHGALAIKDIFIAVLVEQRTLLNTIYDRTKQQVESYAGRLGKPITAPPPVLWETERPLVPLVHRYHGIGFALPGVNMPQDLFSRAQWPTALSHVFHWGARESIFIWSFMLAGVSTANMFLLQHIQIIVSDPQRLIGMNLTEITQEITPGMLKALELNRALNWAAPMIDVAAGFAPSFPWSDFFTDSKILSGWLIPLLAFGLWIAANNSSFSRHFRQDNPLPQALYSHFLILLMQGGMQTSLTALLGYNNAPLLASMPVSVLVGSMLALRPAMSATLLFLVEALISMCHKTIPLRDGQPQNLDYLTGRDHFVRRWQVPTSVPYSSHPALSDVENKEVTKESANNPVVDLTVPHPTRIDLIPYWTQRFNAPHPSLLPYPPAFEIH